MTQIIFIESIGSDDVSLCSKSVLPTVIVVQLKECIMKSMDLILDIIAHIHAKG